jgi:Spy/CpxP family protein refolding chaperone
MRTYHWWIGGVVAALAMAFPCAAAERTADGPGAAPPAGKDKPAAAAERGGERAGGERGRIRELGPYDAMAKTVELTDQQKEDIKKLLVDQQKEMQELMAKQREAVLALLTPEQRAKWQTEQKLQLVAGAFSSVKFTDEQKAKIAALLADVEMPTGGRGREGAEAFQKIQKSILEDVLTPEQREAWQTDRSVRMFTDRFVRLGVTDDQKAEIAKMVKTAKLPAAPGERVDREAYRKLEQDIIDDVLTPEQRAKVEKEQKDREARDGAAREGGKREGGAREGTR